MSPIDGVRQFIRGRILRQRPPSTWPFESGKYHVVNATAPVVVVMPGKEAMAADLAALSVRGLCMSTPACRNASDIEKLIRNLDSNRAIQVVLLAGGLEESSPVVDALRALLGDSAEISEKTRSIVHSVRGKLKSLDLSDLGQRIKLVNMQECGDVDKIIATVNRLESDAKRPDTGFVVQNHDTVLGVERVIAATDIVHALAPDKAGHYAIRLEDKAIVVEQYNSKDELIRLIEGASARDLCITLIRNGWVTKLDHAAYLGRELARAEENLRNGIPYTQDTESAPPQPTADNDAT